jgi:hypothetical protein
LGGNKGKDKVIMVRVGKMIIKTRTTLTMIYQIIILVRARKKNER